MPPTTISRRVLGCLLLILFSQYGDAWKSRRYIEILTSLQRIENMFVKHAEQDALNCLIPAKKLFSLVSELSKIPSNESNETNPRKFWAPFGPESLLTLRKAIDPDDDTQQLLPNKQKQRRNNNRNENLNTNINANVNTNQLRARRTLDDSILQPSKTHNRNVNSNFNVNTNLNKLDLYDYSDEEGEI